MKKKLALIMIGVMTACFIGGCGAAGAGKSATGNSGKNVTEGTKVVEEVVEEVEEVDQVEQAEEIEGPAPDDAVSENDVAEEAAEEESFTEIEIGSDGTVNGSEFPKVRDSVADTDKTDDYGVYSISCFDLDEFLDENSELPGSSEYENTDWDNYTGRWAYPVMSPCRFFNDLELSEKSDKEEVFYSNDSESDNHFVIVISSGLYNYNWWNSIRQEDDYAWEAYEGSSFTVQTSEGESEVCAHVTSYGVDDGWYRYHNYIYNLGNFSVEIMCGDYPEDGEPLDLSPEDVQTIVDNIHLVNGLER